MKTLNHRPDWANIIIRLCSERGMNQKTLAKKMRLSVARISSLLGGSSPPSPVLLGKFEKALDIPADRMDQIHRMAARAIGYRV